MIGPIPSGLVEDVERFKSRMAAIDRKLGARGLEEPGARVAVADACSAVVASLGRHIDLDRERETEMGAYVFRETSAVLTLSTLVHRAYAKPRGYAGDYGVMELVYQNEPRGACRLGKLVDNWALELPSARAVRNRRSLMAATIQEQGRHETERPVRVTSVACGSARELVDVLLGRPAIEMQAVAIDLDAEALAFAAASAAASGVSHAITFIQDNVVRLATGTSRAQLPPQDLIYSVGLVDYFDDATALALIEWMFEHLRPGGRAVLGNFAPTNPDRPFLKHVIEWPLVYRTPVQLQALFAGSRFGSARVQWEAAGVQLFAFASRR